MASTISVVIAAGEGGAGLAATLRALYAQLYDDIEIVVLARAAVDVVDDVPGVTVVRCECVSSWCRFAAARQAVGDVVAFLDAGVIPMPTWAEKLLAGYDRPEIAAVGGAVASVSSMAIVNRQHVQDRADGRMWEVDAPYGLYCSGKANPLLVLDELNFSIRKSALSAQVGFDGSYSAFGAAELGRQIVDQGFQLAVAAHAVVRDYRSRLSAVPVPAPCHANCVAADIPFDQPARAFVPLAFERRFRRRPRFVIGPTSTMYDAMPCEWLSGLHLLVPGAIDLVVSPIAGPGLGAAWMHQVPALGTGVCSVPVSPELLKLGTEAGLLRELLRLRAVEQASSIDDLRPPGGWPLMELLAADAVTRQRHIAELVAEELGCGSDTADCLAQELLGADLYPVSLPGVVRRTLTLTDSEFVAALFESVLGRPASEQEQAHFLAEVVLPGGRTRCVRNLASSGEGPQQSGTGSWVEVVDREVEVARLERLPAVLTLPSKEFVTEAYSAILRRLPDPSGFAHFEVLARNPELRLSVLNSIASSAEAQSIGVDAARAVRSMGFRPHRRGLSVVRANQLWRSRLTSR